MGLNVPLLGCDGWDSPKLVEIGGPEALNNTYFSSAYSAQDKEPSVQKFIAGKLTYDADHNPITSAIIIELKDGVQTFKEKITL